MQSYTATTRMNPGIPALRSFALLKGQTVLITRTHSEISRANVVALGSSFHTPAP